jgi:hypothetical protein
VERLVELQVDDGLPVYVVPVRPAARVLQTMQSGSPTEKRPSSGESLS